MAETFAGQTFSAVVDDTDKAPGLRPVGVSLLGALACVTVIGIVFRPPIVSIGPLLDPIREHFRLSHTQASLLTAIPDLLMGVLAAPAPALARRYGRDRVILAALGVLLCALVLRALATSAFSLLLSTAAVGAGVAVAGALVGGFIKAAFPDRAPLLVGAYAAALALGATLSAALSEPVASMGTWRLGAGIWAAPVIAAIGAWLFVENAQRSTSSSKGPRYRLPFRRRKAWLIGLFYAADNFLYYSIVAWIATLYRERGVDAATAGLILASFTGTFLVSNLLTGLVSRNKDRRRLLAAVSAVAAIGLLGLALAPGWMPFLWLPVISFGVGGGFTLGMTLSLDNTRDADEANVWGAFMLLVAYAIASTGPLLVGALRDATGGFDVALWLLVAVGVAMLLLTKFLGPEDVPAGGSATS